MENNIWNIKPVLIIIILSIFLSLVISFFIFNIQEPTFTGFAVYDDISTGNLQQGNIPVNVSRDTALKAINESEDIIKQMQENNFSVNYVQDNLIEAKRVFEQAEYASILRGEVNSSEKMKIEARDALRLVKWQDITYSDVLIYTEDIKNRKEDAFLLLDKISVENRNIQINEAELKTAGLFSSPQFQVSDETMAIFEQAKTAFSEERYNDTENLLKDFNAAVEKEKAQASTLSGLRKGAMNFFQRYWIHISVILIIIGAIVYFFYRKLEKRLLEKKINKMKTEEQVLNDLMKKTQEERFKENKISGLVYNIRMKKYQERLQEIREELPVLKLNLKKKNSG